MDTETNHPLWYHSLILHRFDVQIHLTLVSMDQSGFMQSSHGVAALNGFSNELFIFLNTGFPHGKHLQEKQVIFNYIKTINRLGNCESSF